MGRSSTNLEMLTIIRKDKKVIRTTKTRKFQYFGHMMRGKKLKILHLILGGGNR